MYAYIHTTCSQPAYLMADKPEPRRFFLSAPLYDLGGKPLPPGHGHTCLSCGGDMFGQAADIRNVVNHLQWKQEHGAKHSKIRQMTVK